MKISDGSGRGHEAGVNSRGMMEVVAVTRDQVKDGAFHARAYTIGSGLITLTSANESSVLYIKNNHITDWLQMEVGDVSTGPSTGGSAASSVKVRGYANPLTGSIITLGTIAVAGSTGSNSPYICNGNMSSRAIAPITAIGGAEGLTQSGSSGLFGTRILATGQNLSLLSAVVLGPGSSVVYTIQPPTSNTSMQVSMHLVMNFVSADEVP